MLIDSVPNGTEDIVKTALRRGAAAALFVAMPLGMSACGGEEKPSKADVKSGMTKMLAKDAAGSGAESADAVAKMSSCLVDETYSKLSTKALSAIAKGDEESKALTTDDEKALSTGTDACEKKLTK